eukprot:5448928-Pyramimonas_sp.AAC.1
MVAASHKRRRHNRCHIHASSTRVVKGVRVSCNVIAASAICERCTLLNGRTCQATPLLSTHSTPPCRNNTPRNSRR